MPLSGGVLWALWMALAWAAFFFRPKQLVLTERSVPMGKRLTVALLTLLYCFALPTIVVFAVVFFGGLATGLGRAFSG